MITCSYCAKELELMQNGPYINHAYCDLCQVVLGPDSEYGMYAENGERAAKKRLPMVTVEWASKPLPELMKLHTVDLIHLLRLAREERASVYNLLRVFNRAIKEGENQFENIAEEQGRDYELATRLCWRIENVLIERIGYFPEKITDEFYHRYEDRCQERASKTKNMKIRVQSKE